MCCVRSTMVQHIQSVHQKSNLHDINNNIIHVPNLFCRILPNSPSPLHNNNNRNTNHVNNNSNSHNSNHNHTNNNHNTNNDNNNHLDNGHNNRQPTTPSLFPCSGPSSPSPPDSVSESSSTSSHSPASLPSPSGSSGPPPPSSKNVAFPGLRDRYICVCPRASECQSTFICEKLLYDHMKQHKYFKCPSCM